MRKELVDENDRKDGQGGTSKKTVADLHWSLLQEPHNGKGFDHTPF